MQLDAARVGDLLDQLADQRAAEVIEACGLDHEGIGAADDVGLVIGREPAGRMRVAGVGRHRLCAQDGKAVDRHALGQGLVARERDGALGIAGAVAGYVDDAARRPERRAAELRQGVVDAGADGGAAGVHTRGSANEPGEAVGVLPALDQAPADDHALLVVVRPFDEAERDAAAAALGHGLDDAGIGDRGCIAFALQLELLGIDAAGDVGREHEQQVDLVVVGSRGPDGETDRQEHERNRHRAEPHEHASPRNRPSASPR